MSRYLVILDEFGMPLEILEHKEDILKYLENEPDSEAIEREDGEDC